MKLRNFWMLGALCGGLLSCSDEMVFQEEEEKVLSEAPFTIYASNGVDTRLQYGEDGLTLQWNDQDQLLLIDVTGKLKPIPLTTTLEAPSTSAIFRSETAVPAGTYFVRNVGRMNRAPSIQSNSEFMTFGNRNDIEFELSHGYFQEREGLLEDIDLYAEQPITVNEGQVSVDVKLKHAYAMIKIKIVNADGKWSENGRKQIGMLCPDQAFPMKSQMDAEGKITNLLESPKLPFMQVTATYGSLKAEITPETVLNDYAALILPVDLSNKTVYFYVSDIAEGGANDHEKVYEIEKEGINLQAGVCYTVTLDLSQAKEIEIKNGQLSTPDHFRALAYRYSPSKTYTVTQDIDFGESTSPYFPIIAYSNRFVIEGENHTLRNLVINWDFKGAGLLSSCIGNNNCFIQNLKMESVTVQGTDNVGAFCGLTRNLILKNCHLLGENTITGTGNQVGGLVGGESQAHSCEFETCEVSENTIVTGKDFVGGLAGGAGKFTGCSSAAQVNGGNNVGGIVGYVSWDISQCNSSATVTATGDNVGGIAGYNHEYGYKIEESSFSGELKGNDYVGGIIGLGEYRLGVSVCYSKGKISGNAYVGGIAGKENNIDICYSLSTVEGKVGASTGGIVGEIGSMVTNCYFAGTVSNGYGIAGVAKLNSAGKYTNMATCITTAKNLSSSDSEADSQFTGLASIKDNVSVINDSKKYATEDVNMWEAPFEHCPKFLWQITDGGDHETEVPPLTEENW